MIRPLLRIASLTCFSPGAGDPDKILLCLPVDRIVTGDARRKLVAMAIDSDRVAMTICSNKSLAGRARRADFYPRCHRTSGSGLRRRVIGSFRYFPVPKYTTKPRDHPMLPHCRTRRNGLCIPLPRRCKQQGTVRWLLPVLRAVLVTSIRHTFRAGHGDK